MKLADFQLNLRDRIFLPLVVGGMGVDISTSALALEIARLGGIGHISDAMVPYVSDKRFGTNFQRDKFEHYKYLRNSPNKAEIRWDPDIVYAAQRTYTGAAMEAKHGSGAVFVNVMEKLTMGEPRETLRARLSGALDAGVDGITLSAGLHLGSFKLIESHARFRDAFLGIIVSSLRALKPFLHSAAKVSRLPDYIIVEGPLAGGHLGFGMDWAEYDLVSIVKEIVEFLAENNLDIPLIPAGGIFDSSDALGMIHLGAKAVQVATRFTISQECGLPEAVKQKYLAASEEEVFVTTVSPTGYPLRMLRSSPCLDSNIRPNCEALGYMLDKNGCCAYRDAYENTGVDENGRKRNIQEKMCICHHFMRYQCHTCGHNVYRLKETTLKLPDGRYRVPRAEEIFNDYLFSEANV